MQTVSKAHCATAQPEVTTRVGLRMKIRWGGGWETLGEVALWQQDHRMVTNHAGLCVLRLWRPDRDGNYEDFLLPPGDSYAFKHGYGFVCKHPIAHKIARPAGAWRCKPAQGKYARHATAVLYRDSGRKPRLTTMA
jgi:hypothetical protein